MTAALLAATDPLREVSAFNELFIQMLVILGGLLVVSVVLLKLVLPRLMRKRGRRRAGAVIDVVETYRLEPRKTVYLLRVGAQYYLVGSCDGQLTTLAGEPLDNAALAEALAGNENPAPPARFAAVLAERERQDDADAPRSSQAS